MQEDTLKSMALACLERRTRYSKEGISDEKTAILWSRDCCIVAAEPDGL